MKPLGVLTTARGRSAFRTPLAPRVALVKRDPNRTDPCLDLPCGQITMPDNPSPALAVRQISMRRDMSLDFRFHRLGKQPTGARPQDVRQRVIGK